MKSDVSSQAEVKSNNKPSLLYLWKTCKVCWRSNMKKKPIQRMNWNLASLHCFSCARHKCLKFQTSHAFYVPTPQNSQTKFCCKSTNTENFKGCTKTILGRKKDCSTLSTKHKQEKTNFYTMSQIISIFSIISWQSWFLATSSAVQCHNITLLHIWYIKNPAPKNLIQWSHLQKTLPQRTTISFGNLGLCKLDIL